MNRILIYGATLLLTVALVHRLYTRGGPYFEPPRTVVDHVGRHEHETRAALLLLPQVAPLLPRGAHVTVFRPLHGVEHYDAPNFLTATGLLERQWIQPPFTAGLIIPKEDLVEFVIAIGEPFTHPSYKPYAGFPEGTVYKVDR